MHGRWAPVSGSLVGGALPYQTENAIGQKALVAGLGSVEPLLQKSKPGADAEGEERSGHVRACGDFTLY